MAISINKFIDAAESQIGVKWRHLGRTPDKTLDCLGLIRYAALEAGVMDQGHDHNSYRREGDLELMVEALETYCNEIKPNELTRGDIVLFRMKDRSLHLAIMLDKEIFIHAYAVTGKVCRNRLNDIWKPLVFKTYRLRGAK